MYKPKLQKIDGNWKCTGHSTWDGGSTFQIAYTRWHLQVYKRLPK